MNDTTNSNVAYEEPLQNEVTVIGFNRRLIAALYDGFLVAFITFILVFALGFLAIFVDMFKQDGLDDARVQGIMVLSALIASFLYFVISWGRSGQTVGKAISGIKIVRKDGTPLGMGKAILRYFGYIISAIVFSLGFLWIGFDSKRQGWHDKIAGSLVTLSDDSFAGEEVTFSPSDSGSSKWVWLVVWFVLVLVAPGALVGGALWMLGPIVRRMLVG